MTSFNVFLDADIRKIRNLYNFDKIGADFLILLDVRNPIKHYCACST